MCECHGLSKVVIIVIMIKKLSNVDPESCSRLDVQCLMQILEAHLC